jgi:biopolymer transport protein ExbB
MRRHLSLGRAIKRLGASGLVVLVVFAAGAFAGDVVRADRAGNERHSEMAVAAGAASHDSADGDRILAIAGQLKNGLLAWYTSTPPADRVTWGGLVACAVLGSFVLFERLAQLRRRKIVPASFTARFLDRLHDGKVDCGQALDHCELNPSPAARVALAAVRRWGRPAADLERAVALAHRVETDGLRRNVGTLRRIAVLAPLLGLLGTLFAIGRALEGVPDTSSPGAGAAISVPVTSLPGAAPISLGSALAMALTPLSTGIVIATIALIAYDGLLIRIEKLAGSLDRLGAETIDAIAMTAPIGPPPITLAPVASRGVSTKLEDSPGGAAPAPRLPHHVHFRADEGAEPLRRLGPGETGF